MGRLAEAMPQTLRTAARMLRCDLRPDARRDAGDLLLALAAVECGATIGGPDGVPAGLLRDLVIITGALASKLRPRPDHSVPAAARFSALHTAAQPPALPVLDSILASYLDTHLPWAPSTASPTTSGGRRTHIPSRIRHSLTHHHARHNAIAPVSAAIADA